MLVFAKTTILHFTAVLPKVRRVDVGETVRMINLNDKNLTNNLIKVWTSKP